MHNAHRTVNIMSNEMKKREKYTNSNDITLLEWFIFRLLPEKSALQGIEMLTRLNCVFDYNHTLWIYISYVTLYTISCIKYQLCISRIPM